MAEPEPIEPIETKIEALYDKLDRIDHYTLLGVAATPFHRGMRAVMT